jgi:hypothetical protein
MEDRTDPLRVSLGQVVVGGHDVDAAPDQRVEVRRQRRDEGLALAGAHLGDGPPMQDDAAQELHVVMALAERPHHRLANRGEGLRKDLLQRRVDLRQLLLALLLELVGHPGRVGPGQRRLAGVGVRIGLAQLDRREEVADALAQACAEGIGARGEGLV